MKRHQKDDERKVTLQILIWLVTAAVFIYIVVMMRVISTTQQGSGDSLDVTEGHNYDMSGLLMEGFPSKSRTGQQSTKAEAEAWKQTELFETESLLLKKEIQKSLRGALQDAND